MKAKLNYVVTFGVLLSLFSAFSAPLAAQAATKKVAVKKSRRTYHLTVSAIPGADERNFDNPTSRCLTASMKALNQKALNQMKADVEKFGTDHPNAVSTYKMNLETVWSAMEQPYCGYGSLGITAVKKSFLKSIDRVREKFLTETKKPETVALNK